MPGLGDIWGEREELLHPRGPDGRWIRSGGVPLGIIDSIMKFLGGFRPRTFQSRGQASHYAWNQSHKRPGRMGGISMARLAADLPDANEDLRDGVIDNPSTEKFVKMMDQSAIELPDDLVISRTVGVDAFGFTPETANGTDATTPGIRGVSGKLIADRGYFLGAVSGPLPNGTPGPGRVRMIVAAPKGTKAMFPGADPNDGSIFLDRGQPLRVTKVEPDGAGGWNMYVAAVGDRTEGEIPAPVAGPVGRAVGTPQEREARVRRMEEQHQKRGQAEGDASVEAQAAGREAARQAMLQDVAANPPAQNPRDVVPQEPIPGGPPPRNEPIHSPSIGGTPESGAPAPAPVPEAPVAPQRVVDLRLAVRDADIPAPAAGPKRKQFNEAYEGIINGKKNPIDAARELDRDAKDLRAVGDDDADSFEKLSALIKEQYGLESPRPGVVQKKAVKKAAAPAPVPRTAAGLPKVDRESVLQAREAALEQRRKDREAAGLSGPDTAPAPEIPAAPKAATRPPAKKATGVVTKRSSKEVAADLNNAKTRDEANAVLDKLTGKELKDLATEIGMPIRRQDKKTIQVDLVDYTVGGRLDSKAIRGDSDLPSGESPGSIARDLRRLEAEAAAPAPAPAKKTSRELEAEANRLVGRRGKEVDEKIARLRAQSRLAELEERGKEPDLDKLTKDELLAVAEKRDIKVAKSWTKDKIKAALRGETPAPVKRAPAKKAAPSAKQERIDSMATALHEDWRTSFHKTFRADPDNAGKEPTRLKKTKDKTWIEAHGTDQVDIANTDYADLPEDWKKENHDAAEVIEGILSGRGGTVDLDDEATRLEVGEEIHAAWLERNSWAAGGELDVPFADLSKVEQDKDIDQLRVAMGASAPKRAAPRRLAAPKAPFDAKDIGTRIKGAKTREEADAALEGLTVDQLKRVAKEIDMPLRQQGARKELLRADIVDSAVGARVDTAALGEMARGMMRTGPRGLGTPGGGPSIADRIRAAKTRVEAEEILAGLSKKDLEKVGTDLEITWRNGKGSTRAQMIEDIGGTVSIRSIFQGEGAFRQSMGVGEAPRPRDAEAAERMSPERAERLVPEGSVPGLRTTVPVDNAPRKKELREAWRDAGIQAPPGPRRVALEEIKEDMLSGKLSPEEGIRRLETEIAFNKEDRTELEAHLRDADLGPEERREFEGRLADLDQGIEAQETTSKFLRLYFKDETPSKAEVKEVVPEVKDLLPKETVSWLDNATPEDIDEGAELAGLDKPKGDTAEEKFEDALRQVITRELESRKAKKATKAAKKAAPAKKVAPPKVPMEREKIDARLMAEDLNLDESDKWTKDVLDEVQRALDGEEVSGLGENPTPAAVGRHLEDRGHQRMTTAVYMHGGWHHDRLTDAGHPQEELDRRKAEDQAAYDGIKEQVDRIRELAERLKKTRRRPAKKAAPATPAEEKVDVLENRIINDALDRLREGKTPAQRRAAVAGLTHTELRQLSKHTGGDGSGNRNNLTDELVTRFTPEPAVPKVPEGGSDEERVKALRRHAEVTRQLAGMRQANNPPGSFHHTKGLADEKEADRLDAEADAMERALTPAPATDDRAARSARLRALRERAITDLHAQGFPDPRPEMVEQQMLTLREQDQTDLVRSRSGGAPTPVTPEGSTASRLLRELSQEDEKGFPMTREDAMAMLKQRAGSKKSLQEMARELDVPGMGRLTSEELRQEIVNATVGRRRDSIATRGFAGPRPDQPDVVPATPVPAKKAAKAAVPGAAPGTAAGKITAARLQPGMRILVDAKGDPTNRKTGSRVVTIDSVGRTTGGTSSSGAPSRRSRVLIIGKDEEGNRVEVPGGAAPGQTFMVAPEPGAAPARKAAKAAAPEPAGTVRAEGYSSAANTQLRVVADGNGGYVGERQSRASGEWQVDPSLGTGNTPRDITSRQPQGKWRMVAPPAKKAAPAAAAPAPKGLAPGSQPVDMKALPEGFRAYVKNQGTAQERYQVFDQDGNPVLGISISNEEVGDNEGRRTLGETVQRFHVTVRGRPDIKGNMTKTPDEAVTEGLDMLEKAKRVPSPGAAARALSGPTGTSPAAPGPPVRGAGHKVTDSQGRIVPQERSKADEPIYLPNGGADQGRVHLDSDLGTLWADLYMEDREPNSFINEIAHIGEDVGTGKLPLATALTRLKTMKDRATDSAVADRIQKAIDNMDAPPVTVPDLPDTVPAVVQKALRDLAEIPTARRTGRVGMGQRKQSVFDEKLDIIRRIEAGDDDRELDMKLSNRDLHESVDGALEMWRIFERLRMDQAVRRWRMDAWRRAHPKEE